MKKILSLLGTITLIGTNTTGLIACDKKYTETELKELKEENKININGNTLEGMAPQEKPFNQADNKGYFVIGRGNKNDDGKIIKFNNDIDLNSISLKRKLDHGKLHDLFVSPNGLVIYRYDFTYESDKGGEINSNYFKSVYRGEIQGEPKTPIIDSKTGEVTDGNNIKR